MNFLIMNFLVWILIIFAISNKTITAKLNKYSPTWESLDSRPLPNWYDEAKVGIFIHWGVWSVPAAGFNESAYLWQKIKNNQTQATEFMKKNYPPNFQYPEFASSFKSEFYSPEEWTDIFKSSGAKYIVFVSKHHDGYSMWPSANSFNWNSMDVGPKRDLLGELFAAVRENTDLKMGVYYSLYEFFNDLYLSDKSSNFSNNDYIKVKVLPQLKDLVLRYKPEVVWTDGDWEAFSDYWTSKEFLAWLYNDSPVADSVVVNDRWGIDALCKHGGFLTCSDRFNPRSANDRKWENAMTLDLESWGYRKNFKLSDVITIEQLIEEIVTTVSCGGNILINVGPTSEGKISAIFEERLRQMGEWLSYNGEAIYKTIPWTSQNDTLNDNQVWYTSRFSRITYKQNLIEVYAICLKWPSLLRSYDEDFNTIKLNSTIECDKISAVELLGYKNKGNSLGYQDSINFYCNDDDDPYTISIDIKRLNQAFTMSKWAWTFKLYLIL